MFNKARLQDALTAYKQDFETKLWKNEQYKWKAIKCFKDNWDVNAPDFAGMLKRSLAKTYNLLASTNNFPAKMITVFAKSAPEEVRAMFLALFDESGDVVDRILKFKEASAQLLKKYGNGAGQHFQTENAISVYLWLRYPEKYYIYKYSEVKKVAEELDSDYQFTQGAYARNLRSFYALYDEISAELWYDTKLIRLLNGHLTPDCYPDPQLRTLTVDVGFYISRYYSQKASVPSENWFPADYSPEISTEQWVGLLNDPEIFTVGSLEIMKRFKDYGGQATCTQLAIKYGGSANLYNSGSSALARRVAEKTGSRCVTEETFAIGRCSTSEKTQERRMKAASYGSFGTNYPKRWSRSTCHRLSFTLLRSPEMRRAAIGGSTQIRRSGALPPCLSVKCNPTRSSTRTETSAAFSRTSLTQKPAI